MQRHLTPQLCCKGINKMRAQRATEAPFSAEAHVIQNGAREFDLRGSQRGEINAAHRCTAELAKYAIERDHRHLCRRGDLDAQRLAARGEINDQARINAAGPNALRSRGVREIEIRGKGLPVPVCDFEIGLSHDSIGYAVITTKSWAPASGSTMTSHGARRAGSRRSSGQGRYPDEVSTQPTAYAGAQSR